MEDPKTFRFVVPEGQPLQRVDLFLAQQNLPLSRTGLQRLIKAGKVKINDRTAKSSDKVSPGQTCTCEINKGILHPPSRLEPVPMNLEIVYEDEFLMAVNKPPGITVHPGAGTHQPTLAQGLLAYSRQLSDAGGWEKPGIVHRLDRDTSGILLVAKTNPVHLEMARQFAERKIRKEYWALTWGTWAESEMELEAAVGRQKSDRKKMSVVKEGRQASTHFVQDQAHGFCTEMRAFPKTGRTHQIRAHLRYLHHPVVGDDLYGGGKTALGTVPPMHRQMAEQLLKRVERQMLHARRIEFQHPITAVFLSLEAPFPSDIQAAKRFFSETKTRQ